MSNHERNKTLFIFFLITTLLLVLSPSFFVSLDTNDNYTESPKQKTIETEQEIVLDELIVKTADEDDSIIRSGSTMHIEGSLLYLIEKWHDLEVYDISALEEPLLLATYSALELGYESKMIIQDNYIYISGGYGDFYVLDCTNPLAITEKANFTNLLDMENFAINNWSLNIITEYQIYDFENFATPTLVGDYNDTAAGFSDFTIKGNNTYILDKNKGFLILNLTTPNNIQLLCKRTLIEGHYYSPLYINGTRLFIFDIIDEELYIFDITIPFLASIITICDIFPDVDRILIEGSIIFLVNHNGFDIIDGSELPTLQLLSSYDSDYFVSFETIRLHNDHIILHNSYIAELQERFPIHIVNINDLHNPIHLYPTGNPYGFPEWIVPVVIAVAVTVVVGPLIIIVIIVSVKNRKQHI